MGFLKNLWKNISGDKTSFGSFVGFVGVSGLLPWTELNMFLIFLGGAIGGTGAVHKIAKWKKEIAKG